MNDLEEVLHIFECHSFHKLSMMEGEWEYYSRSEMKERIKTTLDELRYFQEHHLEPLLTELEWRRKKDMWESTEVECNGVLTEVVINDAIVMNEED